MRGKLQRKRALESAEALSDSFGCSDKYTHIRKLVSGREMLLEMIRHNHPRAHIGLQIDDVSASKSWEHWVEFSEEYCLSSGGKLTLD